MVEESCRVVPKSGRKKFHPSVSSLTSWKWLDEQYARKIPAGGLDGGN